MQLKTIIATSATAALLVAPSWAAADGGPSADVPVPAAGSVGAASNPGTEAREGATARKPATPGPRASAKAKRKAYGAYCKNESRKRADGEKGTAFSRCVNALARVGSGRASGLRAACRDASKKRVAGEKGTAFSRCMAAAGKLQGDLEEAEEVEEVEETEQSEEVESSGEEQLTV